MKSLRELVSPYESVSFIGMCKNAGKTTTFNQLVKELREGKVTFAATSVGRDGESTDLVTNTVKPGIFVYQGTVIATASDLLKHCDITKEILRTTGIYTPMGEIVVVRAQSDGFVQLAGPSITTQLAEVSQDFRQLGVDKILIDGALGRKSLCTKKVSQSTILCTGASYHKDIRKVVADTAYICSLLELPEADIHLEEEETLFENGGKYFPVHPDGTLELSGERKNPEVIWRRSNPDAPERVYVHGGLTDAMVKPLLMSNANLKGKKMVMKDGSRILLSADVYNKLRIKGLSFEVSDAIHLLAVTVNPFSAYGFHFDKKEFQERMREAVSVPVYDVRDYKKGEESCS